MIEKRIQRKPLEKTLNSLDLYSRVFLGQYDEIYNYISFKLDFNKDSPSKFLLRNIRGQLIPKLEGCDFNTSLGIYNPETHERAKEAYDILQVLRYQLAQFDNPKDKSNIAAYYPSMSAYWSSMNISKQDRDTYKNLIKSWEYKDVFPKGYHQTWDCPLVIKNIEKTYIVLKKQMEYPIGCQWIVLKMDDEVLNVINKANEFADFIDKLEIVEAFKYLYSGFITPQIEKDLKIVQQNIRERVLKIRK